MTNDLILPRKVITYETICILISLQKLEYETKMIPGPICFNWHYIIWIKNFITLFATLILPFTLMAYWNCKALSVNRRRRTIRRKLNLPMYGKIQRFQNYEEYSEEFIIPKAEVVSLDQGTFTAKLRVDQDIGKSSL